MSECVRTRLAEQRILQFASTSKQASNSNKAQASNHNEDTLKMFGTWDIVRPRYWHPMASLEQSMMDMDDLADRMLRRHAAFPSPLHTTSLFAAAPSTTMDDDDFFRDLPLSGRRAAQSEQPPQQTTDATKSDSDSDNQPQPSTESASPSQQQPQHMFSTYSFSNSSILDDKGRRIVSTRRRYEDSNGRLKAVHEREIEGKKMRAVWNRMHKDDEGEHETTICAGGGTPEEFEQAWKTTPFGEAQATQQQTIEDTPAADKPQLAQQ